MPLIAKTADGAEVQPGDAVTDHRGTPWVFVGATDRTEPGRSGKVLVTPEDGGSRRQFYATVFRLTVSEG
jgi:hypothetical protein